MNDHASNRSFSDSPDWWGPRWDGRTGVGTGVGRRNLSILNLIEAGTIDPWVAALLWDLIARRSSVIVIAGPSGVGKTTLLTALTDFLPPAERLLPVRGGYDPLDFLDDPAIEPEATTALVNEISPHLPIYLWGPGVGRLLTSRRPFRIFATAHAPSAQDLVAQLAGYPLRVPLAGIARLDVVVRIEAWRDGEAVRRAVTELTAFDPSERNGIVLRPLLSAGDNSLDHAAVTAWIGAAAEKGGESRIAMRHKILLRPGELWSGLGGSGPSRRSHFATAFARASGDT